MADNAHEERFRLHEDILRSLATSLAAQQTINDRLTLAIERIDRTLAQQAEFNGDVRTTLARLETLLARMLRPDDNGREA